MIFRTIFLAFTSLVLFGFFYGKDSFEDLKLRILHKDTWLFERGKAEHRAKEYAKAAISWEEACELNHLKSCHNLMTLYAQGLGVAKDEKKVFELSLKTCNNGEFPIDCNNVGLTYIKGEGVAKDENKAMEFFTLACERKNANACANLGARLAQNKNTKEAIEPLKFACNGGIFEACDILALFYQDDGYDIAQDRKTAFEYSKKACNDNFAMSCARLTLFDEFVGEQEKANLLKKSCELGFSAACSFIKESRNILEILKASNQFILNCSKDNDKTCKDFKQKMLEDCQSGNDSACMIEKMFK